MQQDMYLHFHTHIQQIIGVLAQVWAKVFWSLWMPLGKVFQGHGNGLWPLLLGGSASQSA